jgi:hypothetical protein
MALRVSDDDASWELAIPLDGCILQALQVQMARLEVDGGPSGLLSKRIAERVATSILEVLDIDLKPPTDAQVSFAIAIARELNVNLPGEALLFRGAMSDFLTRFVPLFNERRSRPSRRTRDRPNF